MDGDEDGFLVKVDVQNLETETLYDGVYTSGLGVNDDKIFFINTNDENRMYCIDKNGENLNLVTQDKYSYGSYIYGEKLVYTDYYDDPGTTAVDNIYICNLDGSDKQSIMKEY